MNQQKIAPIILFLCLVASCEKTIKPDTERKSIKADSKEEIITKGKYLVTITGCNDCHSPKRMGPKGPELIPELLLSGYPADRPVPGFEQKRAQQGFAQMNEDMTAAAGPWGISFAANLTPDESGAASWPLENFKKALQHGKSKGLENGRMLLPPMPWFNYTDMKDEDVEAIFEYLKTVKPVKNVVPQPVSFSK